VFGQILESESTGVSALQEHRPPPADAAAAQSWQAESVPDHYVSSGLAFEVDDTYCFGERVYHDIGAGWFVDYYGGANGYGSWASGPDDIWVGGWCRGLKEYDGLYWTHNGCWTSTYDNGIVTGIWGYTPSDVWASCDHGDLLTYSGDWAWDTISTTARVDLWDVWGVSHDEVYAVGSRGVILRYDGASWNQLSGVPTDQALNAIWSSGPDDVFAVGDWGTILHYDGASWAVQDSGTLEHLFDVWGVSGQHVYAVGFDGTLLTYDGSTWSPEDLGSDQDLYTVWGLVDESDDTLTVWTGGGGSKVFKRTMTAPPLPEIEVAGRGVTIPTMDDTPDAADGTDFGENALPGDAVVHTFTITNTGDADLVLGDDPRVDIVGQNPQDFAVTRQPGSPVAVGGSTTFEVAFAPTEMGAREAVVTFVNDDLDETPYTFAIRGTGTAPEMELFGSHNPIADGDDTPAVHDGTAFGEANVGCDVITHSFTIENQGTADLHLTGDPRVAISGTHAADFTVTTQPDSPVGAEGSTTFAVAFAPTGPGLREATVSIANDDGDEDPYTFAVQGTGRAAPTVDFSGAPYSVGEGCGTARITVTLSADWNQAVTVTYGTRDGSATTADGDYSSASGQLVFTPGETTRKFDVAIVDDDRDEPAEETVDLRLSDAVNASGTPISTTLTIRDDDEPPAVDFDRAAYSAEEDVGSATVTVTLDAPSGRVVTVGYTTVGGTATAGEDYQPTSGTLVFDPDVTGRSFVVDVVADEVVEGEETVTLSLFDADNATIGENSPAVLTIFEVFRVYVPLVLR